MPMKKFKTKNYEGAWNFDFYNSLYDGRYVFQLRSNRVNLDIEMGKKQAQFLRKKMNEIIEEDKHD